MSVNIRYAQAEDMGALRMMWDVCFGDPKIWTNWFFDNRVRLKDILCLEQNDMIVSSVHMMPRQLLLRGIPVATGFIVGAATLPQARNQGLMAALLRASFIEMQKKGYIFSYLYPFNWDFYRKFGYEVMNDVLNCRMPYDAPLPKPQTRIAVEKPGPDVKKSSLWHSYSLFAQQYSGMVSRDGNLFAQRIQEHLLEAGEIYTARRKASLCGYALCRSLEDRMEISELVYQDADTLLALLGAVLSDSDGRELTCVLPLDMEETVRLWRIAYKRAPYGMLRVLDAPGALRLLGCAEAAADKTLEIISDADIPSNNGCFTCGGQPADGQPAFRMPVSKLAQWLCGYKALSQLVPAPDISNKGNDVINYLEQAVPALKTYIFEQY